eukprot:TRINITY_DN40047_c0_g1_i1.p1 TRINITY_DN40047_c0_g1~~TRINITY_DN40047_c0_g1_i1.p1  ORF type:complete len:560 (-),score=78.35 TRINITY_DN40047_c0_g1_i1:195-1874(-)
MQKVSAVTAIAATAAVAQLAGSKCFAWGMLCGPSELCQPVTRRASRTVATVGVAANAGREEARDESKDLFDQMDNNGDGVPLNDIMAVMDENGDGTVSREEFEKFKRKLAAASDVDEETSQGGFPPSGQGRGSGGSSGGGGGAGRGGSGTGSSSSGRESDVPQPPLMYLGLVVLLVAILGLVALVHGKRSRRRGETVRTIARSVQPGSRGSSAAGLLICVALVVAAVLLHHLVRIMAPAQAASNEVTFSDGIVSMEATARHEEFSTQRRAWLLVCGVATCLVVGLAIVAVILFARHLSRKRGIQFVQRIGSGTYGEVWQGEVDGKVVAVKIIKGEMDKSELQAEFDILERCQHDNIVRVIAFRAHPPSLIMELCRESVYQRIHERNAPVQVRTFLLDTIQGLHYLHDMQVVHRDLKSHNVLLNQYNTAKLADFGLARVSTASARFTTRSFVGTVSYVAPEAFSISDPKYSFKSDIYAYAVLAWEVAARRIPYRKAEPSAIIGAVMQGKREDLELLVDQDLRPIIEKAWAQDPAERYTSNELLALLQDKSMRLWPALMTN